jgi:branched-chain amino acid transport system substrate-binding protein
MKMKLGQLGLLIASAAITLHAPAMPAFAQECTAKIGAVGPLSGSASAWGLAAKEGAEFIAALVNSEGGIQLGDKKCNVTVISFDSQYTAAGGAAGANFLASENVHVTVGPVGSPETTGFRPVASRSGIVNFSSSYMRDVITPDFPFAFHALQAPITWGPILVKTAQQQFGFKSVNIIAPNDQGGTDSGEQLKKMYEEVGAETAIEYFQRGTTNFSAIATRIMGANPDAIEMSSVPPGDAAILTKQLLEAGYEGVIGSLGGTGLAPIIDGAGGIENLTNVYWLETSPVDAPGLVKMREEYEKVMGKKAPSNPLFPVFAMATEVVLQGVSAAGTDADGEKIAVALRGLTPESRYMGKANWRGKSLYGINQELTFPPGIGMIVSGEKKPTTVVTIEGE